MGDDAADEFVPARTVGEWRAQLAPSQAVVLDKAPARGKTKWRLVRWQTRDVYRCVRHGARDFESEERVQTDAATGALRESDFYIFEHKDELVPRREMEPRYEAVMRVAKDGGAAYYVLVKKDHLRRAYVASGRDDLEQAWTMMPDRTPYWVDRYAFGRERARATRKRYKREK